MKLAHFSDIHLTKSLPSDVSAVKVWAALASSIATGRRRRFQDTELQIAQLLADIDAQRVDHVLCTGDVTAVASEPEFSAVADLFGERARDGKHYTCIPGNHDRYLPRASGRFERRFGLLCNGGTFPFVKAFGDAGTIVGVDVSRPTGLLDSSGLIGDPGLSALQDVLTDRSLRQRFVVLAIHYGLQTSTGARDSLHHRLHGDLALKALLEREDVFVDVVLHGHLHRPFVTRTPRRWIVNAGSATDLGVACGYFLLDIDAEARTVKLQRRNWNSVLLSYCEDEASDLARSFQTR